MIFLIDTDTDIRIPIPIYQYRYRYISVSVKSIGLSLGGREYFYLKCDFSPRISKINVQRVGQVVLKFKLGNMEYRETVFWSSGPQRQSSSKLEYVEI